MTTIPTFETREAAQAALPSTPDAEGVAQAKAKAAACFKSREESWERSDTDGFLSQWASGLTGQLHQREAELAAHGGLATFRVLVHIESGAIVSCRTAERRAPGGYLTTEWVLPRAWWNLGYIRDWRRPAKYAERGLRVAYANLPAKAVTEGRGTGLSGTAWVAVVAIGISAGGAAAA